MLEELVPYLSGSGLGAVLFVLGRWGIKIDKALSAQNLATEKLIVRLDGHEQLDDARFAAIRDILASNGRPG